MEQLPESLPDNPLPLLNEWLKHAKAADVLPNPDAMTLATVSESGAVSARIILCKMLVEEPGYLIFYTNYESPKGIDIGSGSRVAGVFHWDKLDRQVRIEGIAVRSPDDESDAYFATRDKESQIGAWTSVQSQPLGSRQELKDKHVATARKLADLQDESGKTEIPRPPFWGGYRIWIDKVEFWCRGEARLHDRGCWTRSLEASDRGFKVDDWTCTRLQP
ncbi:MAG: pyridoxamine 5'-phosphate oxidase [Gammaproteobacteria bacterium]|jgi:pyridoxamine 5'-phosphate oxidase|nr:pyridoxamine 5'-phosphate oxidase [Gammaproteobacteria bacterium]MDP6695357.1 pyridoxamine 5'-phosphate oxidase [Gammaproteobacteria bacterium]